MPTTWPSEVAVPDVETLIRRVAELERTQQQEDVEGFLDLFDPNAVWVTGGGVRLIGFEAIAEFTRNVLPGATSDGSATYEVEHIAFTHTDVALTGVRQQYVDFQGNPKQGAAGLPSYVWRRTGQVWKIVAGQSTTKAR